MRLPLWSWRMRWITQINASGDNDPTAETLAQTIVMLAKQGERDPVRLEQRAIEILAGQPPDLSVHIALVGST